MSEPEYLRKKILEESSGSSKGVALSLVELIKETPWVQRFVKTSSLTGEGISDLYELVHEVFCSCGDLT
jgi:putative protein kinase ArgK-like GTPase of G3E family